MRKLTVALTFAALAVSGKAASAQANVIENESASVYVDASLGSDSNPGTQALPVKTVGVGAKLALNNNVKGIGTKVLVNPGIYRELVQIYPKYHQTTAPITIQAVQNGTAIIDAADLLTAWNPAGTPGVYQYAWKNPFSACAVPSGWPAGIQQIALRHEMVFVNGVALAQVLSAADLAAGTFYMDPVAQQLLIHPAPGTDMSTAVVETSTRPDTLDISGRTNVVVRGLALRHGASCINQNSMNIYNSTNILIDNVTSTWNNWGGLGIGATSNITVQNSTSSYNGGVGFNTFQDKNVLFQADEADYNNWRGAQGALYDWGMGGTKFFSTHGATVSHYSAYNNLAQGLWFDTDNKNIAVSNAALVGNALSNLQVEANEGPISIQNSAFCSGGMGVNLLTSANVTISGNTFYGNGNAAHYYHAQIMVAGRAGGRDVTDWETGQNYHVLSTNTKLQSNSFQDGASGQQVFVTYLNSTDWGKFTSGFNSNSNQWYDSLQPSAFALPGGHKVDMKGWKGATGQDAASQWAPSASATTSCAVPVPAVPDFNVFADNRTYTMSKGAATLNMQVRSFGQALPVSVSVHNLPNGVTASIGVNNLASGNIPIVLKASHSATAQTVPVTIYAQTATSTHSVTVSVAITPGA